MTEPLAEFSGLTRAYGGTTALGPLDLTIPGGSVALLGPNGAGKSTLIRLMLGILPPTTGTLKVLGETVTSGRSALRRRLGYVPEGDAQFPELRGIEAVTYAGRLVGMSQGDALQRAHQVLDYVELGEERYRLSAKYSTGMKQRLKLAQALVHDPDLLILDEPTEGVDPEARIHLLKLIRDLGKEHGLQLLISSHLFHDVERLATHGVVLNHGKLVTHGALADLKSTRAQGYMLRVIGDAKPLEERLTREGVKWEHAMWSLRIQLDDPRDVIKHVDAAGLTIRHLAPVELTLEEAFAQIVGGGRPA